MKNYNDIYDMKQEMCDMVHTAYSKGYDKGYADCIENNDQLIEESYQKGLDDAWRCAVKIVNSPLSDAKILEEIFDTTLPEDILPTTSASEAIAKIEKYEEKKKADKGIGVGDEVMVDERRMIVLGIDSGGWKQLWWPSGGVVYDNIITSEMTKTGRHFDIQSLIDQVKEGE